MSDFFDASGNRISDGLTARASDVNTLRDEVGAGFDLLPDKADLNNGTVNYAVDSGAADAYVVAMPQTATSYVDGLLVAFKAANANTGAATINVDSLGVKSLKRQSGAALVAGDITANKILTFRYNATSGTFELMQATLNSPLPISDGGTGRATGTTAYGLIAAGTTATGAQQTLAAGLTTEMLVGGGASALPVWTAATGSGAPVRAASPTLSGVVSVTGTGAEAGITVTGDGAGGYRGHVTISDGTKTFKTQVYNSQVQVFTLGVYGVAFGVNGSLNSFALNSDGSVAFLPNISISAGGSSVKRIDIGDGGQAIYFGSGAPTVSAAQGSLYIRTDGSTTTSRMYINTNGSTGWTSVVTAA